MVSCITEAEREQFLPRKPKWRRDCFLLFLQKPSQEDTFGRNRNAKEWGVTMRPLYVIRFRKEPVYGDEFCKEPVYGDEFRDLYIGWVCRWKFFVWKWILVLRKANYRKQFRRRCAKSVIRLWISDHIGTVSELRRPKQLTLLVIFGALGIWCRIQFLRILGAPKSLRGR